MVIEIIKGIIYLLFISGFIWYTILGFLLMRARISILGEKIDLHNLKNNPDFGDYKNVASQIQKKSRIPTILIIIASILFLAISIIGSID